MKTYEIEMDDGKVYEIDVEEESVPSQTQQPAQSPELWGGNDPVSAFMRFSRNVGSGTARGLTGGFVPENVMPPPDPNSVGGMIGNVGGSLAGFGKARGLAIAGGKALKMAPGLAKLGASALAGAYATPGERGLGAALGGVGETIATFLPKLVKFGGAKTAQKIAEKADKGFHKAYETIETKYDDLFSKIKEGTAKSDDIVEAMNEAKANSTTDSIIGRKMGNYAKELSESKEINVERLQKLKQEIRKLVPKSVWKGTSDANSDQHFAKEVYYKVNDALAKIGGEKYLGLNDEYKTFKKAQDLARQFFYEKGQPSGLRVGSPMSEAARRGMAGINKGLSPEDKFMQDFLAWRRGQNVKKVAPWVVGGGAGSVIADRILNRQ